MDLKELKEDYYKKRIESLESEVKMLRMLVEIQESKILRYEIDKEE